MANFLIAYKKTGGFEGGWNHIKGDTGGETYCGIARNYWPKWAGWAIIDSKKPIKTGTIFKDNAKLEDLVHAFYKTNFWDVVGGDDIEDQTIANTLYDFGVNAGTSRSVKQIQGALGLAQTGKVDKALVEAINNPSKNLLK
ncbi:hypothetical protein MA9V1_191 [Chryseobacterium phage MA9V-1]|nr:hypothetical protein MA9V1_191 [Chryseobacterium phage MA9V-1]